jgi:NAD(P)-dependent dehydrogenase (short-subunit alcohol dehydrogenase family)
MTFEIDLTGYRALVTGGGQGVGRGICLALSSAGAAIVVNDYVAERAEQVAEEVRAAGGDARALPFDVTDYPAVSTAFAAAGPVDILVNNAGNAGQQNYAMSLFMHTEPQDWDRYLGVNLYGVMYCTRAALPGMAERGHGRVITIVSEAGRSGEPQLAAYSAAKAGAAGFMRSIAKEGGRFGITANNLALGTIDTFGIAEGAKDNPAAAAALEKRLKPYIIRRLGDPSDVAGLVTFLASPMGSWITGQTYPVNGGYAINQ